MTAIEWTDETWNPTKGCSRVSPGCDHCYAMGQARRQDKPGKPYHGLTIYRESGKRRGVDWSGRVRFAPDALDAPLRWRKPRRVFVNSMSDLFHESLSNEQIAAVFGVMAACPRHTFQVLTKRSKRMREWFAWAAIDARGRDWDVIDLVLSHTSDPNGNLLRAELGDDGERWPLPNVWLGVSAEDQQRADERIPDLLATPAAVRFVSAEPLLGPIDFGRVQWETCGDCDPCIWAAGRRIPSAKVECGQKYPLATLHEGEGGIDWLIVGGESGTRARPCDVAWIRSIVDQCKAAGVACFVKQLGAHPVFRSPLQRFETFGPNGKAFALAPGAEMVVSGGLRHRKGADPSEWPPELRVREFPTHRSSSDG